MIRLTLADTYTPASQWALPQGDGHEPYNDRWLDAFLCVQLQDVISRRYYGLPFKAISVEDRVHIRAMVEEFIAQVSQELSK